MVSLKHIKFGIDAVKSRIFGSLTLVALGLLPVKSFAAADWLVGRVTNITSTTAGLMIKMDTGVPDNCRSTPYGWMLIPEANRTMVATALMSWATGQQSVTIYTNPPSSGWCIVNQYDPG